MPLTTVLPDSLNALIAAALAVTIALMLHAVVFRVMKRMTQSSDSASDSVLLKRLSSPTRVSLVALALVLVAREVPMLTAVWAKVASFVMPILVGWMVLAILRALIESMRLRTDITVEDNLKARRKRTKLTMLNRLVTFIVVFVVIGLVLLSIPGVRDIGVTLVASAGLAGLAVGAAAQPALKSLIAGVQMALTEPINIDDVVIVEGEWGWIEDIHTTYVVVKIWDERRLIVPTNYFLEQPFQNWTKSTAQLLGAVKLYLDPATQIQPIRQEFERLIKAHRLWDGRYQATHVTGAERDAIELRFLMSAKDSLVLFELRCEIREAMLAWLAENQPEAFARTRLASPDGISIAMDEQKAA
jgi:small-conductance mechanosensitive channel